MLKKRAGSRKQFEKKLARVLFSFVVAILVFYFAENHELEEIKPGELPVLYANVCQDDLEKLFVEAIQNAEHSIFLIIYSLSDEKLITALNKQAEKGLSVTVLHDITTHQTGFQKLKMNVVNQGIKRAGLMHQKILIIDQEKVWIGSANMTTDSLKLHDNLVIGVIHKDLASAIFHEKPYAHFTIGEQNIEYWDCPKKGKEGLKRLVQLIDETEKTIKVAMFTWTHPELTAAVIRAHQRGVSVQIVHDSGQGSGVCLNTIENLRHVGIDVRLSSGLGLLHHKFAWLDDKILINGSANWTISAFTRNRDCFLILYTLAPQQKAKLHELWEKTYRSAHLFYLDLAA
jgi:cardiolipin synthase A/B